MLGMGRSYRSRGERDPSSIWEGARGSAYGGIGIAAQLFAEGEIGMDQTKRRMAGFTLIEVMIVVVVIGILAAIAYPSYQNYILKSQRADAHDALLRIQLEQERWRANNPEYTGDLSDLGLSSLSDDEHYELTISDSSGSSFTATASPQGRQANDSRCQTITLTVAGGSADRDGSPGGEEECW